MNESTFDIILNNLYGFIKNDEKIDKNIIISSLKKLKPFHVDMLFKFSFQHSSEYYVNIIDNYHNVSNELLKKSFDLVLHNPKTTLNFWLFLFKKYPNYLITESQEKIVQFPLDYFPDLFAKTPMTPSKLTNCLYNLFKSPKENEGKLQFIVDHQKKGFLPLHQDMYYFMLFVNFMETNSLKKRKYFSQTEKIEKIHKVKITEKIEYTANFIYKNFPNIAEFIKPAALKKWLFGFCCWYLVF